MIFKRTHKCSFFLYIYDRISKEGDFYENL